MMSRISRGGGRTSARARVILAASGVVGLLVLASAVASCAQATEAADIRDEAATLPEAAAPLGAVDATADGPDAADCDAQSTGCTATELACAEADFCAVPSGIDARYALRAVWGSSATDVWAVGSAGTVIHWDGAAWMTVPCARKDTLRAVWGSSASDVWIVSAPNVIFKSSGFSGGSASLVRQPGRDPEDPSNFTGSILTTMRGNGPGDFFVGGPAKLSYPTNSLWRHRSVADAGPDAETGDAWEGSSTFCADSPCVGVNGVWGTSESDLWLVGDNGRLLRSKGAVGDGGGSAQWSNAKTTLTTADLQAIWGSSGSDVWMVGTGGTIRHWSNDAQQRWEITGSPTTETLRAVWGTGPSDAWAVGDAGTILHWDGKTWSVKTATFPVGPKPRLYGIWGSGPNDVWIVGEATVLHFTGPKPAATSKDGSR